jgi:hypothetical protein
MSRTFGALAFAIGLAVVGWVAWGFVGVSTLALGMTCVISAVYALGATELWRYQQATDTLGTALAAPAPTDAAALADWLARLDTRLREPTGQRIEGERVAWPTPALTPYLVGLLVMLGMLGTFLGMVVTFQGAVFALEGSTDLQAIRGALAEPIKGLGLSFGTSVAGVAASAMLGLMSTLCRRERLSQLTRLEARMPALRPFSARQGLADAREKQATELQRASTAQTLQALQALHAQGQGLPDLVHSLHAVTEALAHGHQALGEQLLAQQAAFQRDASQAYTALARSVGESLQSSLVASARAAGDSLLPVVQHAMQAIAAESARSHQNLVDNTQAQLDGVSARFDDTARGVLTSVRDSAQAAAAQAHDAVALQAAQSQALLQALTQARADAEGQWAAHHDERMAQLHGRDTAALQERADVMAQLRTLLGAIEQTSGAQGFAIEALAASAARVMDQASRQFAETLGTQASQTEQLADRIGSSAIELSTLGESFRHGTEVFSASNGRLAEVLQRIEAALQQSLARSDEQLAYYVAQAREVIDLSISAQQGIVEDLRRLHATERAA